MWGYQVPCTTAAMAVGTVYHDIWVHGPFGKDAAVVDQPSMQNCEYITAVQADSRIVACLGKFLELSELQSCGKDGCGASWRLQLPFAS